MTTGELLARSTALGRGDLAAFATEMYAARDLLADGLPDPTEALVSLRDAQGVLVLNTDGHVHQPGVPVMPQVQRAITTGQRQISNLYRSARVGTYRVGIAIPVHAPGSGAAVPVVGVIGVVIPRTRFRAIVVEAGLPPGAVASVQDRTGVTVARSLRDLETVGRPPLQVERDALQRGDFGLLPLGTPTAERIPSTIAYARAPDSAFIVKIDVPEDTFVAPLHKALLRSAAISTLVAGAGLILAWLATRRVVSAFRRVPAAAQAGAAAGGTVPARLGLREADDLAALLARAFAAHETAAADTRALFSNSPIGIAIVDTGGVVRAANDALLDMTARQRSEIDAGGLRWDALVPAKWRDQDTAAIAATLAGTQPDPIEQECHRPDGTRIPVLATFGPTRPDAGLMAIFVVDLTDRRAAETALRQIVVQQRLFIDKAPAGIAMFDSEMRYLAASRRYVRDRRLPLDDPAELIGRSHYEAFPGLPLAWREVHRRVLAGETLSNDDEAFIRVDGKEEWHRWEMTPWPRPDGSIGGALLFSELTTDSKRVTRALRDSEQRFRRVVESSPTAMVMTGADGRIEMANRQAEQLFGYPRGELLMQPIDILIPERLRATHQRHRLLYLADPKSRGMADLRPVAGRRKDATEVPVEVGLTLIETGAGAKVLATIVDLTDRQLQAAALRHSEAQLRQALKMEAIGNLTGGMAHDFNNLLGVIIGNLDLALPMVESNAQAHELIGDALGGALRGADLTQRLLAFARRQPLHPRRVETNQLITGMARLLDRLLGEDIQVALDLADDLWPIIADPTQIESALANLAANARDAMPSGGRLAIVTSNQHIDGDTGPSPSEVIPGDYVVIEITDTGCGMNAEVVAQIFEPFFSTKGTGKGTGLGLSMVFGFIKQSGGHITVRTAPGAGTTLRLYLPRADDSTGEIAASPAIRVPRRAAGETVLVVEDNDILRRVVVRQLTDLGYRAIAARDAAEALDRLAQGDIALLFTDIVMPGELDGFGLARQVQELWPSVRIVLTSGFPDARLPSDAMEMQTLRMLIKPYRREDLAEVLHEVLRPASETSES